jgi:hypothetical protein
MKGQVVVILGAVLLLSAPGLVAATPPVVRKYQVELVLKRGDPEGNEAAGTVEILSRPTLHTQEKQSGTVFIGQEMIVAGEALYVGPRFGVTPESAAGGKIRLRVSYEAMEVVGNGDDQARLRTDRYICVRVVRPGEVVRCMVGGRGKQQTWLELKAREAND